MTKIGRYLTVSVFGHHYNAIIRWHFLDRESAVKLACVDVQQEPLKGDGVDAGQLRGGSARQGRGAQG